MSYDPRDPARRTRGVAEKGHGRRGAAGRLMPFATGLLRRRREHLADVVPVHQVVEERLEVIGAPVAVIDVIGVLPYVAAEDRRGAVHQRVLAVRGLHDGELAVLDRDPGPAGTELRHPGLREVFLDLRETTE